MSTHKHPIERRILVAWILSAGAFAWSLGILPMDARAAKGGKPGGGGGGDGESSAPCVTFDDAVGDSLQSDGGGSYCLDRKANVAVNFSSDGHLSLDTAENNKKDIGRNLWIDFGDDIPIVDAEGTVITTFQTTADLDAQGIGHDVNLYVGAFQDNFNMLTMTQGEVRTDVNLTFTLFMDIGTLFVKMAPSVLDNDRQCEISDSVRVTCVGVDTAGNAVTWRVETQDPYNFACVSQDPFGNALDDLSVGLRNLSFGFTVTK